MEDKNFREETLEKAHAKWRRFFGREPVRAYVRPRYSAGSPAMVSDAIAFQVAKDEKLDYEHALEGIYGEAQQKRAKILGLRGTAYLMAAKSGSGKNFRWLIYDLVTGEYFHRHHDLAIEKMGFTPFAQLDELSKQKINETGRESDYDRTYWKFEKNWVKYEPELISMEDS
jgi:hypothetical protein